MTGALAADFPAMWGFFPRPAVAGLPDASRDAFEPWHGVC